MEINYSTCLFFRPMATNRDACAHWVRPLKGDPFCLAEIDPCPTQGLRLTPEAQLIQNVRAGDAEVEG